MSETKMLIEAIEKFKKQGKKYTSQWFDCCAHLYECDKKIGQKYVREFQKEVTDRAKSGIDVEDNMNYAKKTYQLMAKDDFDSYIIFMEWNREPLKRFYLPRRKQLLVLVEALQALADDELDLLAISLPPGVGKTTLAIFYLTWLAGREPDKPMLGGSHNTAFLRGVYDECLRMIGQGEYLWSEVFQGISVVGTNANAMMIDVGKPKRFATFEFSSIDAGNAGKVRAEQLLYCDDLVSGIAEALSKERMDTLWTKYTTDLRQRKIGNCKELHIATRWSVHDVIGRLERLNENNPRARFIAIPALNENDESNFNYPIPEGFTTQFYLDMRESMDDASFRALYMNQPIEREGQLYNKDELRRFYELPEGEPDAILAICDTAEGGGDDTFMPVMAVYGDNHYCIDCVCSPALPEFTEDMCTDALIKNKVQMCQFESNSAGGKTADNVQKKVKDRGGKTHITKKRTQTNKETKIIVNAGFVKEHVLFLDEQKIKRGSQYARMLDNLCSYTVMGKNKHDDVPDGLAQYALFVQNLTGSKAVIAKRPY